MQASSRSGTPLRTVERHTCVLCAGAGTILYEGLRDYAFGVPGEWRMRRCASPDCGLLWLDPRPAEEDLVRAYEHYHTHAETRQAAVPRLLNSLCRLWSRLGDAFSGLGAQRRQLRMMFLGGTQPGRLLEVGCGGGRFLNRMRKAGWEVAGVELDPQAVRRIAERYGIEVACGTLEAQRYAAGSFDAIAMSQVIEHAHAPDALLRECRRILKPAGRLRLTTPNALSRAHAMYGRHWRGLEPPRHLQIFTPAALARCARESGFVDVHWQTLSAESAGIYQASEAIRAAERGEMLAAGRHCAPWAQQRMEFALVRGQADLGEDLLLLATNPGA